MPSTILTGALALLIGLSPDTSARAVVDTALARMGGVPALAAVERVQLQVMTEWQRITFDPRTAPPVLSYELSTELRDYGRPAWRYSRRFFLPTGLVDVIDVVTDTVAAMWMNGRWRAQNEAYLDERDEAFTFAPERIVRLARAAADLRALPDTTIGGARFARVSATVGRFRPVLHFRRGDGLLALAHLRAAQPSDFGLAPWGTMDVDIWYSRWQKVGDVLVLPTQLDVWRVGRPYKRMTTLGITINPVIPADSFAVADSLRASFLATARKPMFDLPVDSVQVVDGRFAVFGTPGTPAGAIRVGGRWILLEAGTAPLSIERSVTALERRDGTTPLGGALVTAASGAGGLAWLARRTTPVWVAGAARPFVHATLAGWNAGGATVRQLTDNGWIRVGRDSMRVEVVDLPDYPATPIVYVPSLRWVYAWPSGPVQAACVLAHARRRGWDVERVGSARSFVTPVSR
jgi:hypothetical protein